MRSRLRHRSQVFMALAGALAAGITACGSGAGGDSASQLAGGGGQSSIPDNSVLIAAIEPDQALTAALAPAIAESKTVNVGSNIQSASNNFAATEGKTPIGYEVDLAKAVGSKLGVKTAYQ